MQQNPTMSAQRRRVLICWARWLTIANSRAPGCTSCAGSSRCSNIVPIRGPWNAEVPAQRGEPPGGLRLDRPDRASEGDCDVLLREIGQVAEDDDLALSSR